MGYDVTLLRGEVPIPAERHEAALAAVRVLHERNDLKGGGRRVVLPDGTHGWRSHWSFVEDEAVLRASTLVEVLAAFRFLAVLSPDGDMLGVSLDGCTRSRGDERHLWRTLAPFVYAGGEMLWHGEDDRILRWTFDGAAMHEDSGGIVFDRE